ncbi:MULTISPECIES: hypothetical protein [Bradyrhizobium]|uniref:Uncharacterized protein n=2 Tax=Bradyrhizobium TaxID=374 RepID=A0ABY0PJS7_9BRAD|nr:MULTISPECIES: hypothetical protein [Bradyrhizobium]SDI54382.1 hypothetical protein SAMN05444163_3084 [Bradyrhizobium ottawaense]SED43089.1 hypothetical protein SAMN05444171_4085 [Bradyrhizobium lablabi]
MDRSAPKVFRHGSRDPADHGVGYSASGTSEHSRHSAHRASATATTRDEPERLVGARKVEEGRHHGRGKRTRWQLIEENHRRLGKIVERLKIETDPAVLEKLRKNFEIKTAFLARLRAETGEWFVEAIPGEHEV